MRELKSSGVTRHFTRKICCSKMYYVSNNGVNFGFKMFWRPKKVKRVAMIVLSLLYVLYTVGQFTIFRCSDAL